MNHADSLASGAECHATSALARAELRALTKQAMVTSGWSPAIARKAVAEAEQVLGEQATLQAWIREAFRRCPVRSVG